MNQRLATAVYLRIPALVTAAWAGGAKLDLAIYLANVILFAAPQLVWIAVARVLGTGGARWHVVMLVPTVAVVFALAVHWWLSPREDLLLWPLYIAVSLVGMVVAYLVYPRAAGNPGTRT